MNNVFFKNFYSFHIFFIYYSYYSYNYDINYFNQNDINKNSIVQEDYKIILTTSTNEVFIRVFK